MLPMWELVTEWSGIATSNVLEDAASASGTASPARTGSVAIEPRELVIFVVSDGKPSMFGTPGPGTWTALMPVSSDSSVQQAWYAVATSTGTVAPTVSETGHSWDAAVASFRAAR